MDQSNILELDNIPEVAYNNIIQYLSLDDIRNLLMVNKSMYIIITNVLGSRKDALTGNPKTQLCNNFLEEKMLPKIHSSINNLFNILKNDSGGTIGRHYYNFSAHDFNVIYRYQILSNNIWNKHTNVDTNYSYYKNAIRLTLSSLDDTVKSRKRLFCGSHSVDNDTPYLWTRRYTFLMLMWLYIFH